MRKIHTKSRLGCKGCKKRRIKCDELRPSCTRCVQAGFACSYLESAAILPLHSASDSRSSNLIIKPRSGHGPVTNNASVVFGPLPSARPQPTSHAATPPEPSLDERYGSLHLSLLYHFEHELSEGMESTHRNMKALTALFIQQAFTTPYLMDQLLAYSAAHKSTLHEATSDFYATEATRLQTRALSLYNEVNPELGEETCLAMFIFSSLLGHHLLFDLSATSRNDLGSVLDGLTYSIVVHRGIRAIARSSWHMFEEPLQRQFLQSCHGEAKAPTNTSQRECDGLLRRLHRSELSISSISVLVEAAEMLQDLFDKDNQRTAGTDVIVAVQDWLVGVSAEYIQCLNQRRPESLVVLAYYAVLLHRATNCWFVGDLGRRLIHLINCHLGSFWADWLEWPNQTADYQRSAETILT